MDEFRLLGKTPPGVRVLQASGLLSGHPEQVTRMINVQLKAALLCLLYLIAALVGLTVVGPGTSAACDCLFELIALSALTYLPIALSLIFFGNLRKALLESYGDGRWIR